MEETYTINGKEYTREEMNKAFEAISETYRVFVEAVSELVSEIAESFRKIIKYIQEKQESYLERKREQYLNWHIPMDTTKPSQIRMPNVNMPRIRNHI